MFCDRSLKEVLGQGTADPLRKMGRTCREISPRRPSRRLSRRPATLRSMLRLLHLSDIHFSARGGAADINVEDSVRQRMLADIRDVHGDLGDVDAVLIVGDIADWGKENEYAIAADFLDRVCDIVGCDRDQVVCVPGNHDIDRGGHKAVHGALRHQLRTIDGPAISNTLRDLLADPPRSGGPTVAAQNYNTFALRYGCDIALDARCGPRR